MTTGEVMEQAVDKTNEFEGKNLEFVVEYLAEAKAKGENIFYRFKGEKLYSLFDNRDTCYKKVTGYSYQKFLEKKEREREMEEREERARIARARARRSLIEKIPVRIENGMKYIYPQMKTEWEEKVRKATHGTYFGFDIDATIEIMEILANNNDANKYENAMQNLDNLKFGMPYWLVLKNVLDFSKDGVNFFKYAKEKKNEVLSEYEKNYILEIESQNAEFEAELNALEKE